MTETGLTAADVFRFTDQPENPASGIAFLKGHGTENDFVLIPDRAGVLDISEAQVRAVCDRHAGIGADGVIRVAPAADGLGFQMDYRNADGSLAEMCGNGARVFAQFLFDAGWAERGPVVFRTRGGRRTARPETDGRIRVEMGPVQVRAPTPTSARMVDGTWRTYSGVAAYVGNPHLVVRTDVPLTQFDLSIAPTFDPAQFPAGVNIEFVNDSAPDAVSMRVFERGVGETRSCGTGTVAVAAVHLAAAGRHTGDVTVTVPGGTVRVSVSADDSALTGPAVILGSGLLAASWWSAHR